MRWVLLAALAAVLGCSKEGGFKVHDDAAGPPPEDTGPPVDLGPQPDADPFADAAEPEDAGPPVDTGPLPDSGQMMGTMSFFVTSTGNGAMGGNFGGLAGMDAKCQRHAAAVGFGSRTWRAYASGDNPVVDARDRIGTGPWFNRNGVMVATSVATLHSSPPGESVLLDENGAMVPRNVHDIVTGSNAMGQGTGLTCRDWSDGTDTENHDVGHTDWDMYPQGSMSRSWNASHGSGCSQATMNRLLGEGRIYCFALN